MRVFVFAVVLLLAGTMSLHDARADLITNPGFEDTDSNGSFGDGWGAFGAAGFNAFFGANGHASLFLNTPGNSGGVFQTGIAGSFGNFYTFSLDDVLIEPNARATDLSFGLEFFESDDNTIISSSLASIASVTPAGGLSFSHTAAAPVGTAFVRPIISFSGAFTPAMPMAGGANVFVFDTTLTATAVPEPSSVFLFAAASVAGLGIHRRRKRA